MSEIKELSGNQNVYLIILDLASFQSVKNFVVEFQKKNNKLHILVNNAGVFCAPNTTLSTDGYEMHFAVNHLGHFLLTNLLLDMMKTSSPCRIVNVSSVAHASSPKFDFEDINMSKNYSAWKGYGRSKVANILFTKELHRRYHKDGISSFSLHPGIIRTNIFRHSIWSSWLFRPLFKLVGITPQEGSMTMVYCATQPDLEDKSGDYFIKCKPVEPSSMAQDEALAEELWKKSIQLTKLGHHIDLQE